MAWRNKISPNRPRGESNADIDLLTLCHLEGLFPNTEDWIPLTKPDQHYPPQRVVVFLDGEAAHQGREELDAAIDLILIHRGYTVIRERYRPPMPMCQKLSIVERIKVALGKKAS